MKFIVREVMFYVLFIWEVEEVLKRDEEFVRICRFIKEGEWEKLCVDYFLFRDEFCFIGYFVLCGFRIVILRSLRK